MAIYRGERGGRTEGLEVFDLSGHINAGLFCSAISRGRGEVSGSEDSDLSLSDWSGEWRVKSDLLL